jgi:hypothetical protein
MLVQLGVIQSTGKVVAQVRRLGGAPQRPN